MEPTKYIYRHNNIQIVSLEVIKRKCNVFFLNHFYFTYFPIFSAHKALNIKSAYKAISCNYGLFKKKYKFKLLFNKLSISYYY